MKHSTDHIRVSHAGNLPRPDDLDALFKAKPRDESAIRARLATAVVEVVDRQIECGVDIVNDGEYVKAGSYGGYILSRVSGFDSRPVDDSIPPKRGGTAERDRLLFPGTWASGIWMQGSGGVPRPGFFTPGVLPTKTDERICTGPISYIGQDAIAADVEAAKSGIAGKDVEGFIAALGPLSLGAVARNLYYPSEEEFMTACADALHEEYKAITDAGLIVQIDEPEFFTTWSFYPDWEVKDLRDYLAGSVELLNYALRDLPEDQIRFHSCWGSGHRPHVTDIPLKEIVDLFVQVKAQAFSFEAANVQHQHEWKVWEDVKLREGTILVPGVISHATDLVENPEVVAGRLCDYASIVGRENVEAGTDCGIGSRVGHAEIAWAKLKAMGDGAKLATQRLFK